MRGRKFFLAFLITTTLLMITLFPTRQPKAVAAKGVRTQDLVMFYYPDVEAAYEALKNDEIDMIGYEITAALYQDAINDPNIVLTGVADTGFYELDLNNNHTIHTYPGVENPFWYAPVRRAVAWCTDKDYIVNVICGVFAERIDAMIAAPAKAWASPDHWYPSYPYEYDTAVASAHLDANGWVEGSTPNPNYDPGFPGSTQFLRVYPPVHSKAGHDIDAMRWFIATADSRKNYAGHMVADAMEKIGFTINRIEPGPSRHDLLWWSYQISMWKNYHLYTGGWGVGYFPTYLYNIYHSQFWVDGIDSPNYVTGNNASNLPNYPEYDRLVEEVFHPTSLEDARDAAKLATAYWTEHCINVPLFSAKEYWASSAELLGLVNQEAIGFENGFTFMNAYKEDGSAIRYGLKSAPYSMNPQFATWYYTYQNIERIYSYAGVSGQPFDPGAAQSGWLQDWEIGSWNDGGTNKTYMTHWVRNDSYFAEPITGNRLSNVNASDYFFSVWFTYADPTAWRRIDVEDVHHIEIHNSYSWTAYFDFKNYWYYLAASPMLFPVDRWLKEPLATQTIESFSSFTGPDIVALNGNPVWINEVTLDDAPLAFGADYNIIRGNLEVLIAVSGDLSVDYWKYGNPIGFTPGDLLWNETLVGSGMYYMTSFTPGTGGGAAFKRNPYYWMETPPLGEIDFVWNFQAGPKPRDGYYNVDIYDVVLAAGAYGTTSTGLPSAKFVSAADVAPPSGKIDIYDIVTLGGVYGTKWGHPP